MAKLLCAVCETPITLSMTRYQTKDKKKICKGCGKRAGLNAFSSQNITVEELISKDSGTDQYGDKAKKIMKQLEAAGVTDTFGTKKEINHLPEIIADNEVIKYATSGFYEGNTILIVVTDKRIIFLDKGIIYGTTKTEIPLDKVNSVSYKKGMILARLKMYNGAAPIEVENIQNNTIEKLTAIINECLLAYNESNISQNGIIQLPPTSIADELKKFKELLDLGVINQEEFENQKSKLLNNK